VMYASFFLQLLQFETFALGAPSEPVSLFVGREWIFHNEKRLLWLPLDYRPRCTAMHGGSLAIGHNSGRVTFFHSISPGMEQEKQDHKTQMDNMLLRFKHAPIAQVVELTSGSDRPPVQHTPSRKYHRASGTRQRRMRTSNILATFRIYASSKPHSQDVFSRPAPGLTTAGCRVG